jgi:hypothetical protein
MGGEKDGLAKGDQNIRSSSAMGLMTGRVLAV